MRSLPFAFNRLAQSCARISSHECAGFRALVSRKVRQPSYRIAAREGASGVWSILLTAGVGIIVYSESEDAKGYPILNSEKYQARMSLEDVSQLR